MASEAPEAYRRCRAIARAHYENFPVASRLLPARLRDPVAAIYAFARRADDHADEGCLEPGDRLAALDTMAAALDATVAGSPPDDPLWHALADTVVRFDLPAAPFHDLLSAFRQDVTRRRYATFAELRDYCRRSADPVGRLLLHLHGRPTAARLAASDCICTGLQLVNFLQDLHQDWVERERLYIPRSDLERHGLDGEALRAGRSGPAVAALLDHQVERAAAWLYAGRHLPESLQGRFRAEIRLILRGGWAVIERLRAEKPGDPHARPRLRPRDRRWIARGLLPGPVLAGVRPPRGIPADECPPEISIE